MSNNSEKTAAPKTVAARNDLKKVKIVKERPETTGMDPNYHYEWFSMDPRNPGFIEKKLHETAVGDASIGYAVIPDGEGWQPVNRESDPRVQALGIRDDQGKALDSTIRNGNRVLCRIKNDVWQQTHQWADNERNAQESLRMQRGERESHDAGSFNTAVVSSSDDADVSSLLSGVR